MAKTKRIYMPITDAQLKEVERLSKKEKRSKAQIVAIIFNDGLSFIR